MPGTATLSRGSEIVLAVLLLAAQAVLLESVALSTGQTIDEPVYLSAGRSQVRDGRISMNALPAWGFGIAEAVSSTLQDPPFPSEAPTPEARAFRQRRLLAARQATIAVVLAGGAFLFLAARRLGPGAGAFALALWVVSPTVLAHGGLATLDPWAASFLCAFAWGAARLLERPSPGRAAVAGGLAALAGACKITAFGAVPVLLVAAHLADRTMDKALRSRLLQWFGASLLLVLWAVYRFDFGMARWHGARFGPVPFPSFVRNVVAQGHHGFVGGHDNYLWGESRLGSGWWWYYLATLALKVTLGAQALFALRLVQAARRPRAEDALLLAYPFLLFVVMSAGKVQLGVRYLLPAFPFVALWLSGLLAGGRALRAAAVLLLAAGAVDGLRHHPQHLTYFNAWAGGPGKGLTLVNGASDWCQGNDRVADWVEAHRPEPFFYSGCVSYGPLGVPYRAFPCEPTTGTLAIDEAEVSHPRAAPPGCLDWLSREEPDERLGDTERIYRVDEARRACLVERAIRPAAPPCPPR